MVSHFWEQHRRTECVVTANLLIGLSANQLLVWFYDGESEQSLPNNKKRWKHQVNRVSWITFFLNVVCIQLNFLERNFSSYKEKRA